MAQVEDNEEQSAKSKNQSDLVSYWLSQIAAHEARFKKWQDRCADIIKRYRTERKTNSNYEVLDSQYNIFWSNIENYKPSIYTRTPNVQVERRYKDKDPVGRTAGMLIERASDFAIKDFDFDSVMKHSRDDFLLLARGQCWVRYIPTFIDSVDANGQPFKEVVSQKVVAEYINWKDFGHGMGRVWEEVESVWKITYLGRDEFKERFGEEMYKKAKFDFTPEEITNVSSIEEHNTDKFKKCIVYEIWDKKTRRVLWISKSVKDVALDIQDDPLKLKNFFPCPKPLYGTLTNDCLEPIPDFIQYQGLMRELDFVCEQITLLVEAVKVVGVYNASLGEIQQMLNRGVSNQLIAVKNWPMFSEKGGIQGNVDFLPLNEIIQALAQLYQARDKLKNDIWEISGMSDIIRGSSNPNETATAQEIKGQFATLRLAVKQGDMQRFARDTIAIIAEILCEHYDAKTLKQMSAIDLISEENQQYSDQAIALLKDDLLREFRVDIETDSTISVNDNLDKQARTEFTGMFGELLQRSLAFVQAVPSSAAMVGQLMLSSVRGFKAGRQLEASIEQFVAQMTEQAQQAYAQSKAQEGQQQPDPEAMKMQAENQYKMQSLQLDAQKMQLDHERGMQELQLKQGDQQIRLKELSLEEKKAIAELSQRQLENKSTLAIKQYEIQQNMGLKAAMADSDSAIKTAQILKKDRIPDALTDGD